MDFLTISSPFVATFLLGFSTFFLLFWYSSRKQKHWKKLGIPYVEPWPFLGSVVETIRIPLHELEQGRYKKFGRIYGHFEGNRPLLSVAEPDLLRSILVKDFPAFASRRDIATGNRVTESMLSSLKGEDWKRVRSLVTPTFTTGKLKRLMGIFKECSRTLVKNFKAAAEKDGQVDTKNIYEAFTMDIIASSAFSTKIDSNNEANNEFVLAAKNIFSTNFTWRGAVFFIAPWLMTLFKVSLFPAKSLDFFSSATMQIIEERKRTGQTRNDFLQLLLDIAKEQQDEDKLNEQEREKDITENYGNEENKELIRTLTKKTLSFEELVGQCVIFFVAGYHATTATLSFVTYNLALHPEVQENLIQELDDALRENNGELTYEVVQSLKILDNVISETLRIYSPAIRLERVADAEYKLGDTGIVIPKGMLISIPIYAIHRDPEHFPDPEKFDPDRFTSEERAKRHQYSYMPFGAGPRNCVAMRFVLMEIKVCVAHVLTNFRIKRCAKTKVPVKFIKSLGPLEPQDMIVQLEIRKDNVTTLQEE